MFRCFGWFLFNWVGFLGGGGWIFCFLSILFFFIVVVCFLCVFFLCVFLCVCVFIDYMLYASVTPLLISNKTLFAKAALRDCIEVLSHTHTHTHAQTHTYTHTLFTRPGPV